MQGISQFPHCIQHLHCPWRVSLYQLQLILASLHPSSQSWYGALVLGCQVLKAREELSELLGCIPFSFALGHCLIPRPAGKGSQSDPQPWARTATSLYHLLWFVDPLSEWHAHSLHLTSQHCGLSFLHPSGSGSLDWAGLTCTSNSPICSLS